jgi:hypothetical protein
MAEQYNEAIYFKFGRRKDIPGLQCVALISWLSLQLGLNNFHNKPMEGLASECIKDFENYFPNENTFDLITNGFKLLLYKSPT